MPDDVLKEKVPINLKDIFKFKNDEKRGILIEAGPGLGKTMLSFKICKDWANGDLLEDYDAVILLRLRVTELQKAKKINDLLILIEDNDELKQNVQREIYKNNGDRVCFIVEGFDELPQNLQRDSIFTCISEKLPLALVIYTSRPVAISQLLLKLISKHVEIIGFKSEQVQQFVETTLVNINKEELGCEDNGESKAAATELMKIIGSNVFVNRLSHIPIYLSIITYLFYLDKSLPLTRTTLYHLLVKNIILRHLIEKKCDGSKRLESLEALPEKEKKHFANMCRLAFHGLENSEVTFNTEHLHNYDIPEDIKGLGLLCIAQTWCNHGTIQSLNYIHLNFQEFCAAYYVSKLSEHQQYKIFMEHQDDPSFQICWQFFAGLTKLKCQQIMTSMIPKSN